MTDLPPVVVRLSGWKRRTAAGKSVVSVSDADQIAAAVLAILQRLARRVEA